MMRWNPRLLVAGLTLVCTVTAQAPPSRPAGEAAAAIAGGKLPTGYRDWRLISVAREEGDLDDIRAILGNDAAIRAYRDAATLQRCFDCHLALKNEDFVFTRYTP